MRTHRLVFFACLIMALYFTYTCHATTEEGNKPKPEPDSIEQASNAARGAFTSFSSVLNITLSAETPTAEPEESGRTSDDVIIVELHDKDMLTPLRHEHRQHTDIDDDEAPSSTPKMPAGNDDSRAINTGVASPSEQPQQPNDDLDTTSDTFQSIHPHILPAETPSKKEQTPSISTASLFSTAYRAVSLASIAYTSVSILKVHRPIEPLVHQGVVVVSFFGVIAFDAFFYTHKHFDLGPFDPHVVGPIRVETDLGDKSYLVSFTVIAISFIIAGVTVFQFMRVVKPHVYGIMATFATFLAILYLGLLVISVAVHFSAEIEHNHAVLSMNLNLWKQQCKNYSVRTHDLEERSWFASKSSEPTARASACEQQCCKFVSAYRMFRMTGGVLAAEIPNLAEVTV